MRARSGAPASARWLAGLLGLVGLLATVVPGGGHAPVAAAQEDWSEIVRGTPASGVVALTFDAGGVAGPAPRVLDTLRAHGVRVTFFLSGHWVDAYPALAAQVVADGHEVSNHSYTHSDLANLADGTIVWELDYTDHVVKTLTGASTRPYFRPPFGSRNARVLRVAALSGFRSVYWTLDSGDWRPGATAAGVADRVLRLSEPGDIVVLHVASDATAAALPTILQGIEARGWRVGTVSEALGLPRHDEIPPSSPSPDDVEPARDPDQPGA